MQGSWVKGFVGKKGWGLERAGSSGSQKATFGMSRVKGIGFLASEFGVEDCFSVWGICPGVSRSSRRKLAEKSAI